MSNPSLIASAPLTEPKGVKVVYADLVGRVGARMRQLMQFPPSGYRVLAHEQWADKVTDRAARQHRIWAMRNVLNRRVPINLALAYGPMRLKNPPKGVAFTYSESPLIFRPEPWVVGVEVGIQFAGYNHRHLERYRRTVERTLESPHCRAIICYSEAARRSIERALDVERFGQKLHVVYPAGIPKKVVKRELGGEAVRILFVSSDITPGNFELKGGFEALKAFVELRQRFPNLELTIRCDVDPRIRQCYEGTPGLRIVQGLAPRVEFEGFYQKADIFWYPAHTLMSVAMLEAMSYGLPTSDRRLL